MKKRLFSVPYDTSINPSQYINSIKDYKTNIDHLYFSIPTLGNNYHSRYMHDINYEYKKILQENENIKKFLEITKGTFKRILTFNNINSNTMGIDKRVFAETNIIPLLEKYKIEGIIIVDFAIARHIHKIMPKLEICTSCNSFIWTKKEMDCWAEEAGATLFNPPREAIRMPKMLKYFRDTGYKMKYIVNESCMFGCPFKMQHAIDVSFNIINNTRVCYLGKNSNFLRSTFVLPRWLPKLDKYVDIYKISGRMSNLEFIKTALDSYVNLNDNIDIKKIILGGICSPELKKTTIMTKIIPDILLTCECKNCNKTCYICDNIMNSCIQKSQEQNTEK